MITRLRLQNWKSHSRSELEFEKGTNVLVGQMGSGKTSIMDAICFALFGTYPALNARRVSLDETILQKPNPAQSATIELSFVADGKEFTVTRTLFRANKSNQAKLVSENRLVAGPKPTEVTEQIERLLKIDYELFSRCVYSEQNHLDYFLQLSPRERKEKFDELLQIHRYEQARANAVQLFNRIQKNTLDKKRFLEENQPRFSLQRTEELLQKIRIKETALLALETEQAKLGEHTRIAQEKLALLENEERAFRQNTNKHAVCSARHESIQNEIKRLNEKANPTNQITKTQSQLQQQLNEIEEHKTQLRTDQNEIQNQVLDCTQTLGSLRALLQTEHKTQATIRSINGQCPVCQKPLSAHDKESIEHDSSKRSGQLRTQIQNQESLQKILTEKRLLLETEKKRIETQEREHLEQALLLQTQLKEQERLRELHTEEQNLRATRDTIQNELAQTQFEEKKFKMAQETFFQLSERTRSIAVETKMASEYLREMKRQYEDLDRLSKQLEALQTEITHFEDVSEKLVLFTNCLSAMQGQLRETLLSAINQAMEDLWHKIYPYRDFQTAQIRVIDGNYELLVQTSTGEWMRVEGMLSGGERSAAAICIRLSFALVLTQNLGWIILDEPTHNLDTNGVRELGKLLKTHLPELVEQIFVITHDKQLEHSASGALYYIERNKDTDETSNPRKIETISG